VSRKGVHDSLSVTASLMSVDCVKRAQLCMRRSSDEVEADLGEVNA
jgi:hypothetical protein